MMGSDLPLSLDRLRALGVINALSYSATRAAQRLSGERNEQVAIALALCQMAQDLGHLGLRLSSVARDFSPEVLSELKERQREVINEDLLEVETPKHSRSVDEEIDWSLLPDVDQWLELLRESPAIWRTEDPRSARPFVLDGELLFTLGAWRGEVRVTRGLVTLQSTEVGALPYPERMMRRLFGGGDECWFDGPPRWDRARLSLYTALTGAFTVIHGGPGTGKTTLTQRILAELIEQYHEEDRPLRIALTAPTGKAAQRLTESIRARVSFFHLPEEIQAQLEALQGVTLHSLLGVTPDRPPIHSRSNPLPYDVIVVDECSMVDLWLMQSLVEALSTDHELADRRRLILIGDPHQLPSVSAGAPFTELCAQRGKKCSAEQLDRWAGSLKSEPAQVLNDLDLHIDTESDGLVDRVVALNQVRRVSAESGIHAAATAIQKVEELGVDAVLRSFTDDRYQDTALIPAPPIPPSILEEVIRHAMRGVSLAQIEPREALKHMKGLCLLSPHYGGPLGVNELNDYIEEELRNRRSGGWGRGYVGRPVLITQNHPPTGLVNGDIGVVGADHWVYFETREQPVKLSLLPPHRTVFAMSIHKSQGSEFKKVIMCIPPKRSLIMTRELIYTGLTRAKSEAILIGSERALAEAILAKVERGGQLSERLSRGLSAREASR